MSGLFGRFRRWLAIDDEPLPFVATEEDAENGEVRPKDSTQSYSSAQFLEPPSRRVERPSRAASSSMRTDRPRPRSLHRSATDTVRRDDDRGDSRTGHYPSSVLESNSEEESSTAKLSRRSSVLVDLIALFRRSSSFGQRRPSRPFDRDNDDDDLDEEDEGEEQMSKEKVLAAIRRKKESLGRLSSQPWNMKRKRRTLRVAQRYLQRQQAKVSKVHLYRVEFLRRLTQFWRWMRNMRIYLIPWESKIKRIESHFGSVVSSYFTFLRWILYLNLILFTIILLFIVTPEWLADSEWNPIRMKRTEHIKEIPKSIKESADELKTVVDFGGYLQYSYIFYGYYSSETIAAKNTPFWYRVPVAYFVVTILIFVLSLFLILRKMAANARNSKMQGGQNEQYVFSWKVVNGWDYSIGNSETSASLVKANVTKLKEAIAEYNVKLKPKTDFNLIVRRIAVNFVIMSMIGMTGWLIIQANKTDKDTFIKQNAVSIIVSFVTLVFPNLFELIGHIEKWHPRFALRAHLGRVFFLYVVAYYSLFASLFTMLNTLQAQTSMYSMSVPAPTQFAIVYNPNTPLNKTYYEIPASSSGSRRIRQLETEEIPIMTTPLPIEDGGQPWTTVFPNYGPFGVGVYNPKALVLNDKKMQRLSKTVYESRPIGPLGDWNGATTQGPIPLHYTTSPRRHFARYYSKAYRPGGGDICWETMIGQEITKVCFFGHFYSFQVVMTDLVMTIAIILVIDFLRGLWVRYCTTWWCWDLEGRFPEYGEFKISENVLHLIKDQTMVWLGTMFVPLLPAINIAKLIVLMYIRGWAVMTCNVPARQIFRASRSNNFYLILLLLMFVLSTIPVGYVIASIPPSKSCGPFAGRPYFYDIVIDALRTNLNAKLVDTMGSLSSPGIIVPIVLFLLLVIYFMFALIRGLKEANHELSTQLTRERTEEKQRIFKLAGGGRRRPHDGPGIKSSPEKNEKIESPTSPTRSPPRRSRTTPIEEFNHHSPSKSPISPRAAHPSFLPSLQSLKEDDGSPDEEAEESADEPTQHLLQHDPTPQRHPDVRYEDLPPIKLTWKQRFLILIGVEEKDKLEAKLRMRQLAQMSPYSAGGGEQREDDEDDEEEEHREPIMERRRDSDTLSAPAAENEQLEEAEYSASSNGEYSEGIQSDEPPNRGIPQRRRTPAVTSPSTPTVRVSKSPWSGRANSRGTDEEPELTTIIGRPSRTPPHHSQTPPHHRSASQRRTDRLYQPNAWAPPPPQPIDDQQQPRRTLSMNDRRQMQPFVTSIAFNVFSPFERDLVSESSPLDERSHDEMEENRLSPEKRSPPSGTRKRSNGVREYSLDPYRVPVPQSMEGSYWDHAQNRMATSGDDPTRPPSEEEGSFRDPTPSTSDEPPRGSTLMDLTDDRLSYANPYSSYAAAMCSPVFTAELEADPMVNRLRQMPHLSATPEPRSFVTPPLDFYSPPLVPFAATAASVQHPQPYYLTPMSPVTGSLRPPSRSPFPPPIADNYPLYDHTFTPYVPVHSSPQRFVDRNNRSPSGGYGTTGTSGSTHSPTPEVGRPRFRISASPPRPKNYMSEGDSGRGSGSGGEVRRWDLRQRAHPSTDDSSSPERPSPQRLYSQQTTV